MIEVSHLAKKYGSRLAVDDISFTVEDGVIYGLLGPNGAGKSTIMNILTGYLAATEGQVTVAGHPLPEEADAAKACVGYLPEQPPLYPEMTVAEYLDFAADNLCLGRDEQAVVFGYLKCAYRLSVRGVQTFRIIEGDIGCCVFEFDRTVQGA